MLILISFNNWTVQKLTYWHLNVAHEVGNDGVGDEDAAAGEMEMGAVGGEGEGTAAEIGGCLAEEIGVLRGGEQMER